MERISVMNHKHRRELDEKGFASIVIALIFIIVLALITVGFAQLSRREQQNALDKQLGTQANYAAESGINAAYDDIEHGYITQDGAPKNGVNTVKADNTNCMPASSDSNAATYSSSGGTSHPVNTGNGVNYSCLLVSLKTSNLVFNNVAPSSGKHMNFGTDAPLTSLTIYWGSASGRNSSFPGSTSTGFLPSGTWGADKYPPAIEFSITPTSSLGSQPNPTQYLINNTSNVYLYPAQSGNGTCSTNSPLGTCTQGQILSGDCNPGASRTSDKPDAKDYPCSATLTGLGGQSYVIHFTDFYDTSNMYIYGTTSTGSTKFTGEPSVDVTGKARNVLKRLQARILINGGDNGAPDDNDPLPNGAVQSQNLCKRIQAAPAVNDYSSIGSTYDSLGGTNGPCNLSD